MMLSVFLITAIVLMQRTQGASIATSELDNEILTNGVENLESSLRDWVKIQGPPPAVLHQNVGSELELTCEAVGTPPPTIQWYKRNVRITENDSFQNEIVNVKVNSGLAQVTSRLVVNYLLPRHQDIYRCVAESNMHAASAVTKVIVMNKDGREMNFTQLIARNILGAYHKPRVTFFAPSYLETIGSSVVLPCKSVGNPKPNLRWYDPNNKEIVDDERMTIMPEGELRIIGIVWEDMGGYICRVRNSIGEDLVETFLYPMQPSNK